MAVKILEGFRVGGSTPIDERIVRDTVASIFDSTNDETFIAISRRYIGLAIWIKEEHRTYRFVGGITASHFIPDPVGGELFWRTD
jgi:hypothetical protein